MIAKMLSRLLDSLRNIIDANICFSNDFVMLSQMKRNLCFLILIYLTNVFGYLSGDKNLGCLKLHWQDTRGMAPRLPYLGIELIELTIYKRHFLHASPEQWKLFCEYFFHIVLMTPL